MASQGDNHYALEDAHSRDLNRRLLLDEQQRRIDSRRLLEASYRSPICPYFTVSGHEGCWYCHRNTITRPLTSTDILLRDLSRPQSQATTTSVQTETPYQPSSVSSNETITHYSHSITPRSTASATPLTGSGMHHQDPHRKHNPSKPRVPAPIPNDPAAANPLAVLTQPKSVAPLPFKDLPVEDGFVPVTIPPIFTHFLYLPVEIRKRIYAYLVHNGEHGLLMPKDTRVYHQAPITRVNRQIRSESILMVYTNNALEAKNRESTKYSPIFARRIGDYRIGLIRDWTWFTAKRHLFINFLDDNRYKITYKAPDGNDEITAVARDRAMEVYDYLKKQGSFSGFSIAHVTKITEIVLRITPKAKPKEEEKAAKSG